MKKIIFFSLIIWAIASFFVGPLVLAEDPKTSSAGDGGGTAKPATSKAMTIRQSLDEAAKLPGLNKATSKNIPEMVGKVVGMALQFVSLLFLIIIVYAGLRWMLAQGDPGKIKEARSWMINAAVGLLITLMAYQIVAYIIEKIEIKPAAQIDIVVAQLETKVEIENIQLSSSNL